MDGERHGAAAAAAPETLLFLEGHDGEVLG
jgi:hypothetical protein